jgi:hypothetical protein
MTTKRKTSDRDLIADDNGNDVDDPSSSGGSDSSNNHEGCDSSLEEDGDNAAAPRYVYNYTPSKEQLLHQKSLKTHQHHVQTITAAASQVFHVINKYGDGGGSAHRGGNSNNCSITESSSSAGNKKGDTAESTSFDNGSWGDVLTANCNSPWKDIIENNDDSVMNKALDEIVAARNGMMQAWNDCYYYCNSDQSNNHNYYGGTKQQQHKKLEWWEPILLRSDDDDDDKNVQNDLQQQRQFHQVYMEYATNAFSEELEALRKGQLERMCTATTTTNNSHGNNNEMGMVPDLDPTQHSFVVSKHLGNTPNNNNDDGNDEANDVAAADIDVRVLSDMLSSGSHTLSMVERNMLLRARLRGVNASSSTIVSTRDRKKGEDGGELLFTGLSLHDRRRRELGLLLNLTDD